MLIDDFEIRTVTGGMREAWAKLNRVDSTLTALQVKLEELDGRLNRLAGLIGAEKKRSPRPRRRRLDPAAQDDIVQVSRGIGSERRKINR